MASFFLTNENGKEGIHGQSVVKIGGTA